MSSLDMSGTPISNLARSLMESDTTAQAPVTTHTHKHDCDGYGWWALVFWWVVIALIVYFTLFALRPDFVLEKDDFGQACDDIDQGRLLGSAIVISLIIIFVLALFAWGFGYGHGSGYGY